MLFLVLCCWKYDEHACCGSEWNHHSCFWLEMNLFSFILLFLCAIIIIFMGVTRILDMCRVVLVLLMLLMFYLKMMIVEFLLIMIMEMMMILLVVHPLITTGLMWGGWCCFIPYFGLEEMKSHHHQDEDYIWSDVRIRLFGDGKFLWRILKNFLIFSLFSPFDPFFWMIIEFKQESNVLGAAAAAAVSVFSKLMVVLFLIISFHFYSSFFESHFHSWWCLLWDKQIDTTSARFKKWWSSLSLSERFCWSSLNFLYRHSTLFFSSQKK